MYSAWARPTPRAHYADLDSAAPVDASTAAFRDGTAAALGQFPAAMLGLSALDDYLARLGDPDNVPGSAAADGSAWMVPGPAPGTAFRATIDSQARVADTPPVNV